MSLDFNLDFLRKAAEAKDRRCEPALPVKEGVNFGLTPQAGNSEHFDEVKKLHPFCGPDYAGPGVRNLPIGGTFLQSATNSWRPNP